MPPPQITPNPTEIKAILERLTSFFVSAISGCYGDSKGVCKKAKGQGLSRSHDQENDVSKLSEEKSKRDLFLKEYKVRLGLPCF